jgi:hypothetical protein
MRSILKEYSKLQMPDWYIYFKDELTEYFYNYNKTSIDKNDNWFERRELIVKTIVNAINDNTLYIGKTGSSFDSERQPVDTAIIHMTSSSPEKDNKKRDLDYINALCLIRLYCSVYSVKEEKYCGRPIFSGHYYEGKQTFIPYHYLINPDGSFLHILKDEYIGWQAGNWAVNTRSIAIAFVGSFINSSPDNRAILTANNIIKEYQNIKVMGHFEVINTTKCPGNKFKDWKQGLLV